MGWSIFDFDKKAMVEWLLTAIDDEYTVLKHRLVKNHLWILVRNKSDNTTRLALQLLGGPAGKPNWGYKSLSHRDRVDCPLTILRELPPADCDDERIWRECVQAYHLNNKHLAHTKRTLKPGMQVTLYEKEYKLTASMGRLGWCVELLGTGTHYRISTKKLTEAVANQSSAQWGEESA